MISAFWEKKHKKIFDRTNIFLNFFDRFEQIIFPSRLSRSIGQKMEIFQKIEKINFFEFLPIFCSCGYKKHDLDSFFCSFPTEI